MIAEQAGHLTVFQRTAQFTVPAANGPLDPQLVEMWKPNYPEWRRRGRQSHGRLPLHGSVTSALEVIARGAHGRVRGRVGTGRLHVRAGTFSDLLVNEEANATAAEFVRSKIDEIVGDPGVAEILKPPEFPSGPSGCRSTPTTTRPSTDPT